MAVSLFALSALVAESGSDGIISVTIPASTQAGDLAWLKVFSRVNTGTITVTPGGEWSLAHEDTTSTTIHVAYYYRWLVGSDTNPTVTVTATGSLVAATLKIFRGAVGSGSPLDAAVPTNDESAGTAATSPTVTTTTNGCLILREYVGNNDTGNSGGFTTPTESTLGTPTIIETGNGYETTAGADGTFGSAYIQQATAGATGTGGGTWTASITWRGDTFAIKPAAGVAAAVPRATLSVLQAVRRAGNF